MTDQSGTTTYEYTPKGQVKKETKTIDSINYITQYTYDQDGNMTTMTYPSGRVITYNYSNDRAVSVLNNTANLATNISYKPFGGMNGITYGNGLTGTVSYDNQYNITALTVGTSGSILNYSYTDDANGNITGISNTLEPSKAKTFTYDALDRLSTATSAGIWGNLAWTYDGVGNRQTENANTYTYTTGTNKLSTANSLSYTYDNNGNTTAEGTRAYTYNQNQRLIQIVDGSMSAGYTYNGNGQRVKKSVNGTTTVFHYNLSGQIIAESNTSGTITAEYVYLNGAPLAMIEGANTYYYHNDHLSTPQKMTDSSGTVVWAADYKPFGEVNITVNTITNNLRFPGQYYDAETGLNYNYFRDYNPVIGRYVEADPVGIKEGENHLFVYVGNNPVNRIDPYGLFEWVNPYTYWRDFLGGTGDFTGSYVDMLDATYWTGRSHNGWAGQDAYFHCRANCEAAQRGQGGNDAAQCISDTREWFDQLMGDQPSASVADQAANQFGRTQGAANPSGNCSQLCSGYRPGGSFPF